MKPQTAWPRGRQIFHDKFQHSQWFGLSRHQPEQPPPNPEKDSKDSSPCSCACSGADEYGSQLKQPSLGWCQGRKPWETIGFWDCVSLDIIGIRVSYCSGGVVDHFGLLPA